MCERSDVPEWLLEQVVRDMKDDCIAQGRLFLAEAGFGVPVQDALAEWLRERA